MKKIGMIFASIVSLTVVQAAEKMPKAIRSPQDIRALIGKKVTAPVQVKLTKQDIRKKIDAISQNVNALKGTMPSPNQLMINRAKRDLGFVSRGLDSLKREILITLAKKPIKGFNANTSFSDMQKKINQTYKKLQTMSAQERAQTLGQLSTSLTQFQDKVKRAVSTAQLMRLSGIQSRLYVLAEKTKKMPADAKAASAQMIKEKAARLKTDIAHLKTLGLQKEAQDIQAGLKAFKESKETNETNLKNEATALFTKAQEAYKKALLK